MQKLCLGCQRARETRVGFVAKQHESKNTERGTDMWVHRVLHTRSSELLATCMSR
jgi:hypothetical protein